MKIPVPPEQVVSVTIWFAILLVFSNSVIFSAYALSENSSVTYLPLEGKTLLQNGNTWIIFDPVSDRIVGDEVILSGLTNLPVETTIDAWITIPSGPPMYPGQVHVEKYYNEGHASVNSGASPGSNSFSLRFGTKYLVSGDYQITLLSPDSINGYITPPFLLFPNTSRNTIYHLMPSGTDAGTPYWLSIDPSPEKDNNSSRYTLTGSTNLPVGENLSCSVFDRGTRMPGQVTPGVMGDIAENLSPYTGYVIPGPSGYPNRFTLAINTSELSPGSNWVTIWNSRYNASNPAEFLSQSIEIRDESPTVFSSTRYLADEGKILIQQRDFWIKLDPNSDQILGDEVTVSGSTNLSEGSYVLGILESGGSLVKVNMTLVQKGISPGDNSVLLRFDTGNYSSGEYRVQVISSRVEGTTNTFLLFPNASRDTLTHLNPPVSSPVTRYWLSTDLPLKKDDSSRSYTLTGSTNLPAGESLSCSIYDIGTIPENLSQQCKGFVISGQSGYPNRFNLEIKSTGLSPTPKQVTIWNPLYNASDPNAFLSQSIVIPETSE